MEFSSVVFVANRKIKRLKNRGSLRERKRGTLQNIFHYLEMVNLITRKLNLFSHDNNIVDHVVTRKTIKKKQSETFFLLPYMVFTEENYSLVHVTKSIFIMLKLFPTF